MLARVAVVATLFGSPLSGQPSLPAPAAAARIDVEFQDADIHAVFRVFSDVGRVNIVPEAGIAGRVTARLQSVRWDEALEMIVCSHGLEMRQDGNVIHVRKARPPGTPW
jgi:type II secretory pathway component HofQ